MKRGGSGGSGGSCGVSCTGVAPRQLEDVCPVSELVSPTRLTGDRGRLTLNMSLVELRHLEGLQSRRRLGTDGGLGGADTWEVYRAPLGPPGQSGASH